MEVWKTIYSTGLFLVAASGTFPMIGIVGRVVDPYKRDLLATFWGVCIFVGLVLCGVGAILGSVPR